MRIRFVNLTPDPIPLRIGPCERVVEPSGKVARMQLQCDQEELYDGMPCVHTRVGTILDLPPAQYGVVYLVPFIIAQLAHRRDVVSADTGPSAVRAPDGQLQAVTRLLRF